MGISSLRRDGSLDVDLGGAYGLKSVRIVYENVKTKERRTETLNPKDQKTADRIEPGGYVAHSGSRMSGGPTPTSVPSSSSSSRRTARATRGRP